MRVNLPITSIEHPVPEGEVLVSKTNLKGIITYCNRAFCEISGYSEADLLGLPHNVIRHPDVPAAVFDDLWKCIKSGRPWHGIVKNRCKNGDYYWVEANVTPWLEKGETVGYVSLRYRATQEQIAAAAECYRAVHEGQPLAEQSRKPDSRYIVELQQRLAEKIMALEKQHDTREEELRIGSDIMRRITSINGVLDPIVRQMVRPAGHYSGDMVLVARTPADVLHFVLADAVGHGLTAAMNVLPISQAFYGMSKKGFDIAQIAQELNRKIHMFMPVDRFVAAILISIDLRTQLIEVWNGGIPAPLLINPEGEVIHQWKSSNLPLGVLGDQKFVAKTEIYHYEQDCQLFLCSDGLHEAESPQGKPFGNERISALLRQAKPERRYDELVGALEQHLGGEAAHDDVSLAMVNLSTVSDKAGLSCPLRTGMQTELSSDWRLAITLGADELRYVEVVPMLTQIITRIHATHAHHSALFLILSELFNNALDHGVLQLDSKIKRGVDGFERYLEMREERLLALESGSVAIEIEKVVVEGNYAVKIRVVDSGSGFDYAAIRVDPQTQLEQAQHGRGIALVRSLAYKLEFAQRGNEVVVYYVCT